MQNKKLFHLLFSGSCEAENRAWRCRRCKEFVWYDINNKVVICRKCSQVVSSHSKVHFNCNSRHHGFDYIPYKNVEELENQTSKFKAIQRYNILVLGEIGVGKSTWINSIYNYMHYDTLEDATADGNEPIVKIPVISISQ